MIYKRKCPICNSGGGKKIYNLRMYLPMEYQLPDTYDIVSCEKCGFCYADTSATVENYDYYYKNINYYPQKPVTLGYAEILDRWIGIIETVADKKDFIVDMGSGDGQVLIELKKNGFKNIAGIDTTRDGVELLLQNGIQAYESSIYEDMMPEMSERADVLIMSGVFEHLLMPRDALSNVKKWLKKGGKLICLVPNMDNLAATKLPISYFFHHEHINYFTSGSLKYFMGKEGYKEFSIYPKSDEYGNMIAVFEYSGEFDLNEPKDFSGYIKLKSYFERESEKEAAKHQQIEQLVESREPLIIYGCGALLQKMWAETNLREGNIIALVDKNPVKIRDMRVDGFDIISPTELAKKKLEGKICVFCAKGSQSILLDIKALNITNEIFII